MWLFIILKYQIWPEEYTAGGSCGAGNAYAQEQLVSLFPRSFLASEVRVFSLVRALTSFVHRLLSSWCLFCSVFVFSNPASCFCGKADICVRLSLFVVELPSICGFIFITWKAWNLKICPPGAHQKFIVYFHPLFLLLSFPKFMVNLSSRQNKSFCLFWNPYLVHSVCYLTYISAWLFSNWRKFSWSCLCIWKYLCLAHSSEMVDRSILFDMCLAISR